MPKSSWTLACSMTCLLVLAESSARGADPPKKPAEQFRLEYPAAYKKLERFYTNMTMSVKQTCLKESSPVKGQVTYWRFRGDGQSFRRDNRKYEGDDDSASVVVRDPGLSFAAKRKSASEKYSFLWKERPAPVDFDDSLCVFRSQSLACAAPFCTVVGRTVADLIAEKNFELVDASRIVDPGGDLVKIDWNSPLPDGRRCRGRIVFAPDDCWALREMIMHFDGLEEATGKVFEGCLGMNVEYSGKRDGVPLVRQVRTWGEVKAGRKPIWLYEATSLRPGPAPGHDFRPEILGLNPDAAP